MSKENGMNNKSQEFRKIIRDSALALGIAGLAMSNDTPVDDTKAPSVIGHVLLGSSPENEGELDYSVPQKILSLDNGTVIPTSSSAESKKSEDEQDFKRRVDKYFRDVREQEKEIELERTVINRFVDILVGSNVDDLEKWNFARGFISRGDEGRDTISSYITLNNTNFIRIDVEDLETEKIHLHLKNPLQLLPKYANLNTEYDNEYSKPADFTGNQHPFFEIDCSLGQAEQVFRGYLQMVGDVQAGNLTDFGAVNENFRQLGFSVSTE